MRAFGFFSISIAIMPGYVASFFYTIDLTKSLGWSGYLVPVVLIGVWGAMYTMTRPVLKWMDVKI